MWKKKSEINFFFLLKLMKTNARIPQNFKSKNNATIFKFLWFLHFLEGVGFVVVKLVAAKVICQHMIFSTLSFFLILYNNLWNKKNDNHDKWQNIIPVQNVWSSFEHANLVISFRVPNIYQKLDLFEYEHLKCFVWKYDNMFSC